MTDFDAMHEFHPGHGSHPGRGSCLCCREVPPLVEPRAADGDGAVRISGELKQWHKVTLTLDGPFAHERDQRAQPVHRLSADGHVHATSRARPNTACRATSRPTATPPRPRPSPARSGGRIFRPTRPASGPIPCRSSADPARCSIRPRRARNSPSTTASAARSRSRRPTRPAATFAPKAACNTSANTTCGSPAAASISSRPAPMRRKTSWPMPTSTAPCRTSGAGRAGEATPAGLKTWQPHVRDWRDGDPTWKDGKGKGLIGALNYLAGKGCNAFSFLTYNAGGDGDDVWPFVERDDKLHYDCSKLDQWQIVFDHATDARPLPALQDAGDRDRRQPHGRSGTGRAGRSTAATSGPSASSTAAN